MAMATHPTEPATRGRRAWRAVQVVLHSMALVLVFIVALTAGILALSGVAEIDARRHYRAMLQESVGQAQEELAAVVGTQNADDQQRRLNMKTYIATLRNDQRSLRELSETGAVSRFGTLRCVRMSDREACSLSEQAETRVQGALRKVGYAPSSLRDDSILAGVVIFSSIFGTCLSALRSRKLSFTGLAAGSVGGILVFFLIKGGKVFFMLGDETEWTQYNPYSFAVAGILAGLFADAAFRSLTAATESLLDRLTLAFQQKPPANEPPATGKGASSGTKANPSVASPAHDLPQGG